MPPRHLDGTAICEWRTLHWHMRHVASDVAKAGYAVDGRIV
jgi:hypothetical protein